MGEKPQCTTSGRLQIRRMKSSRSLRKISAKSGDQIQGRKVHIPSCVRGGGSILILPREKRNGRRPARASTNRDPRHGGVGNQESPNCQRKKSKSKKKEEYEGINKKIFGEWKTRKGKF